MLTREFFAGRRARYLPPIRLYLVLSVAFFLLLALEQRSAVALSSETRIDTDCAALEYRGPLEATVRPRLQEACLRLQRRSWRRYALCSATPSRRSPCSAVARTTAGSTQLSNCAAGTT
jgi:hypothetical protein